MNRILKEWCVYGAPDLVHFTQVFLLFGGSVEHSITSLANIPVYFSYAEDSRRHVNSSADPSKDCADAPLRRPWPRRSGLSHRLNGSNDSPREWLATPFDEECERLHGLRRI